MIDTVETASKKWCPHARQVWAKFDRLGSFTSLGDTPPFNMVKEDRGQRERRCLCIADSCMMWRSLGVEAEQTSQGSVERHYGYCGLAGIPMTPEKSVKLVDEVRACSARSEAA